MATLEHVRFVPHYITHGQEGPRYLANENRSVIENVPQIFWIDNRPWREANLWAIERATSAGVSIKTVVSNMNGLLNYANFLEVSKTMWYQFPARKSERCLVLYRGALVKSRDAGVISSSTASEYMRNCIMFYRWVRQKKLLNPQFSMWEVRPYLKKYFDQVGFERTFSGLTTDLHVPNRKRSGMILEDGLQPISATDRDAILNYAAASGTQELFLMLALGFFTGMRLGSICDLKINTLVHAVPDPHASGLLRIAIGPSATPPVHTKFSVTGHAWIPQNLRDELIAYTSGWRRLEREAKAAPGNRDLVFLTRFGNPYGRTGVERSSAINVEMSALRRKALYAGFHALRNFRFHQTRCTFGTELARLALSVCSDTALVVAIVSNALLHAPNSEATTFKYIRFVQSLPVRQALSNSFIKAFSGVDFKGYSHE